MGVKNWARKASVAVVVATGCASTAQADSWEPGFNTYLDFAPVYEVEGNAGNSMEGSMLGLGVNYSAGVDYPVRVHANYRQGSSDHRGDLAFEDAEADDRTLTLEGAVGKTFGGEGIEVIPFAGLGLREMRQSFSSSAVAPGNDIATSVRKHRYLYMPLGFYVGSTGAMNQVNIYYSGTFQPVIAGEAKIGASDNAAKMRMNNGYGFRLEAGFHVPTTRSWNVFTGLYVQRWDIDSSDRGVRSSDQGFVVEQETRTKHDEIGLKFGIQM